MKVFISSQSVTSPPAALLINGLRCAGIDVAHSPVNPADGHDPSWFNWYERGYPAALDGCQAFVAVIDDVWDSSTWMAHELDVASGNSSCAVLFWNPAGVKVTARGLKCYLRDELPVGVDHAISALLQRADG